MHLTIHKINVWTILHMTRQSGTSFDKGSDAERDGYLALLELVKTYGWKRRWHGTKWQTYRLDDHDYWVMHPARRNGSSPKMVSSLVG
jgi:hypothetical protein